MSQLPQGANPIHQLEILPVLMASHIWEKNFADRPLIAFVDNEGAKAALVNGASSNEMSAKLVNAVNDKFTKLGTYTWYERVPSVSNPADAPSRGAQPDAPKGWPKPQEVHIPPEVRALAKCHLTFGGR